MKNIVLTFFNIVLFFLLFLNQSWAVTDNVNVQLNILGCNNDGICEPDAGEDNNTCPNDCPLIPDPPDPPIIPTSTPTSRPPSGYRNISELMIYNINTYVDTENQKIFILWETNIPATSILYWGKDQDYQIVTISGVGLKTKHFTVIDDVSVGSYNFLIEVRDFYGKIKFSEVNSFTLRDPQVYFGAQNPTNFRFFSTNTGVGLAWINPNDPNFSRVRLVRELRGYPSSYLDGEVIYEGAGQSVVDYDVTDDQYYYYSIFAIDKDGNVSSGLVLRVKYSLEKKEIIFDDFFRPKSEDDDREKDGGIYIQDLNYKFIQNGLEIIPINDIYVVRGDNVFDIVVDKKYIGSKDEIVIYFNTNFNNRPNVGYKFNYIEKDGIYKLSIPALGYGGEIPFLIRIYDRNGKIKSEKSGILLSLIIRDDNFESGILKKGFFETLYQNLIFYKNIVFISIFSLIFLIFLILFFRKRD